MNEIQESCSSPDLALGEVYGVRQWTLLPAGLPAYYYATVPRKNPDDFCLSGHFSMRWDPRSRDEYTMECSRTSHYRTYDVPLDTHILSGLNDVRSIYSYLLWVIEHLTPVMDTIRKNANRVDPLSTVRLRSATVYPGAPEPFSSRKKKLTVLRSPSTRLVREFYDVVRFPTVGAVMSGVRPRLDSQVLSEMLMSNITQTWLNDFIAGNRGYSQLSMEVQIEYVFPLEHRASDKLVPECTCGFYAYTNAHSLYMNSTPASSPEFETNPDIKVRSPQELEKHFASVFGIVKGYGDTVVGTKGFRSSKMQIVALTTPQFSLSSIAGLDGWVEKRMTEQTRNDVSAFLGRFTPGVQLFRTLDTLLDHASDRYGVEGLQ